MNKKVLIVEDEPDCAELLRHHLRKENFETIIARDGEEAIEAVQCHTPDVVLLDIMLPELDGWEVCRILRDSSKGKMLPVIMLTALSDEEARVKGLRLGADDYISKPYAVQEVLLKVRRHAERQKMIRHLSVREQEQDTTLRYVVHELRNSMTAIGGFSAVALQRDMSNKHLKTIRTAAAHAESLLSDVSLLAKLEREGGLLPPAAFDIAAMARDVAELFHDQAAGKNIKMVVDSNGPAPVRASRTAARQVLINLVSNAVKYNKPGGRIRISIAGHGGDVSVAIRDEGLGIESEELPRIFDKFYRARGSEPVKGAGMGLYIVKHLAEAIGGAVTVASEPGAGSTFTLTLSNISDEALMSVQDGTFKEEQA